MTIEEQRTVIERRASERRADVPLRDLTSDVVTRREVITTRPTWVETTRRIVAFIFGLVQLVILLRIVLLLIDARQSAPIVSAILDASRPLVAPFEGILRTDALRSSGSVLDLAAIAAFIGWTVLEIVVLALVGLFGRDDS